MSRAWMRCLEATVEQEWMALFFKDSENRETLFALKAKFGIEPCDVAAFSFLVAIMRLT